MSYDLAVWAQDGVAAPQECRHRYEQLIRGEASWTVTDQRIDAFWAELTAKFPTAAPADDDIESFAWAVSDITPSGGSVVLTINRARATEVVPVVRTLAVAHGLACYDPQVQHLLAAGGPRSSEPLELLMADGTVLPDPAPASVERAVRGLSSDNWYVVLTRGGGSYVQAGLGPNAGVPEGRFALEYRDGSADRHYRCLVTELDSIVEAFLGFASGTTEWTATHEWQHLSL